MSFTVTVLGTGTSSGVPLIGCDCSTCTSTDPRDVRTRTSIIVERGASKVLIDTSSDFRQQMLRHKIRGVDAVLFTHHHFDHISGFDDLRAFNFHTRRSVACYATEPTSEQIKRMFAYAFGNGTTRGSSVPLVTMNAIVPGREFHVGAFDVLPVPLMHGPLEVMGFRIGDFAYCTDCNGISDASIAMLAGLDVLILDALRYESHPTHFSLREAISMAERIGARQTWFTHIAHEIKHAEAEATLPAGMGITWDGMAWGDVRLLMEDFRFGILASRGASASLECSFTA